MYLSHQVKVRMTKGKKPDQALRDQPGLSGVSRFNVTRGNYYTNIYSTRGCPCSNNFWCINSKKSVNKLLFVFQKTFLWVLISESLKSPRTRRVMTFVVYILVKVTNGLQQPDRIKRTDVCSVQRRWGEASTYAEVVTAVSLWKADTAAVWWCPGSLWEPADRNRNRNV